jgi:hypothetical protein
VPILTFELLYVLLPDVFVLLCICCSLTGVHCAVEVNQQSIASKNKDDVC